MLNTDGVLEVIPDGTLDLDDLGGLTNSRPGSTQRIARRARSCGRSATRRAAGRRPRVREVGASRMRSRREWPVPLVLLDPGRIYRKYIGESEQRFDAALATVAAMAPAVLWIDEIEKGFATGGEDGGVSGRVLATFLRWLQDRDAGVFVVATANDVTRLPAELTRKGRFDELFFVDLPDEDDRVQIFRAQLRRREITLTEIELVGLARSTDGFSGAEIDAALVAASYAGPITAATIAAEVATHRAALAVSCRRHRRRSGPGRPSTLAPRDATSTFRRR